MLVAEGAENMHRRRFKARRSRRRASFIPSRIGDTVHVLAAILRGQSDDNRPLVPRIKRNCQPLEIHRREFALAFFFARPRRAPVRVTERLVHQGNYIAWRRDRVTWKTVEFVATLMN